MAKSDGFAGFPIGEIVYRSSDEDWMERVHRIAERLVELEIPTAPNITHERHELHVSVPGEDEEQEVAVSWPISAERYETLWNPTLEKPAQPAAEAGRAATPLDIFLPDPVEEDEPDPAAEREANVRRTRELLAVRLGVVASVLEEIPSDPFVHAYLDSAGTFDRHRGEHPPLGFNFDGIDRNIHYRAESVMHPLFSTRGMRRSSSAGVDTIVGIHTSLSDGTRYRSDEHRGAWETAFRADLSRLVGKLQTVPPYYLELFDENGYIHGYQHSGIGRQIGTSARREFYRGYYQFAPAGITLLKAARRSNIYGNVEFEDLCGVEDISTVFVALKHRLESRPHLVRLQAVYSGEAEESRAELRVFEYPSALDGRMPHHRIGGYYGDLKDPDETLRLMDADVRAHIPSSITERIRQGHKVGTEFSGFSHGDFYTIVEHLSKLALTDAGY